MTTAPPPTAPAESTFDSSAEFYDALTAHYDYELVMDLLEGLALRHGLDGKRLLDLACGTGKSLAPMIDRGYESTGCELSAAMLDRAAEKLGGRARLLIGDMTRLGTVGEFDLVTCIDEPINYLLDEEAVGSCFKHAAANLAPGGVFLFDLNTVATYRTVFASVSCHEAEGWLFVWRGNGSADFQSGDWTEATIEAFRLGDDGRWDRRTSTHFQRHHPRPDVERLLDAAGLELCAVYGMFPDGSLEPHADDMTHSKVVYVASRSPSDKAPPNQPSTTLPKGSDPLRPTTLNHPQKGVRPLS